MNYNPNDELIKLVMSVSKLGDRCDICGIERNVFVDRYLKEHGPIVQPDEYKDMTYLEFVEHGLFHTHHIWPRDGTLIPIGEKTTCIDCDDNVDYCHICYTIRDSAGNCKCPPPTAAELQEMEHFGQGFDSRKEARLIRRAAQQARRLAESRN